MYEELYILSANARVILCSSSAEPTRVKGRVRAFSCMKKTILVARKVSYVTMPTKRLTHAWKVTTRGREQRRCYFCDDTGHRLKGVQRL